MGAAGGGAGCGRKGWASSSGLRLSFSQGKMGPVALLGAATTPAMHGKGTWVTGLTLAWLGQESGSS